MFDHSSNKRTGSRGPSGKNSKDIPSNEVIKRRNIVNKFVNNSHILVDQPTKIDSRNIYKNSYKHNKNWNSASLNLKKFVKKDLHMGYPMKKEVKKKSHDTKLKAFQANSFAVSGDKHFQSFGTNDNQVLVNPYFSGSADISKSFGSSLYKPSSSSVTSGKKLAALKNCLIMNNGSKQRGSDAKTAKYGTSKTMK